MKTVNTTTSKTINTTSKTRKQATALQSYTYRATTEAHWRSMERHPRPNGLAVYLADDPVTVFVELLFPRHWPVQEILTAIMNRMWRFKTRNGKTLHLWGWGGPSHGKQETAEDVAFLTSRLRSAKKSLRYFQSS